MNINIIDGLAKAIHEVNKNKQSYVAKIVTGKHKGKYVSNLCSNGGSVKTKSKAMRLVISDINEWKHCFAHWNGITKEDCILVTYNKNGV